MCWDGSRSLGSDGGGGLNITFFWKQQAYIYDQLQASEEYAYLHESGFINTWWACESKKKKIIGVREQVQEQGTCHRLNVCLTALFSIHTWEQSVTHICLDTSALCNISMVWWCTWRWSCYSFLPLAFRETEVLTQPVQRLLKLSCLQHRIAKLRLNISSDV